MGNLRARRATDRDRKSGNGKLADYGERGKRRRLPSYFQTENGSNQFFAILPNGARVASDLGG